MASWAQKFTGGSSAPPPATAPLTVNTAGEGVRAAFIRKVYTLLTINFLITIGISCAFMYIDPVQKYVLDNFWILIASLAVTFATLLVLLCLRPKFPLDLICMYVFVLALSTFVGYIASRYEASGYGFSVLMAFISTAAVFFSITIFIAITKKDMSFLHGFLFAGLIVLLVVSLLSFLIPFNRNSGTSRWVYFAISVFGALLMTGYLLYDTSMVMTKYGPDQWLQAVVSLYLDVVNLFLYLLSIFSFVQN